MQYKVPQNVEAEDKLIGPITLRQLIIMAVGGAITYFTFLALYNAVPLIIYMWPVAFFGLLTIAFAFFKKDNKNFTKITLLVTEHYVNPRSRFWIPYADTIHPFRGYEGGDLKPETPKVTVQTTEVLKDLSQISSILDSSGHLPTDTPEENVEDWIRHGHEEELKNHATKIENMLHQPPTS